MRRHSCAPASEPAFFLSNYSALVRQTHNTSLAATLRPLEQTREALAKLETDLSGDAALTALKAGIDGVEATLRRWLRDDASAALSVRLSALAPDEVPVDRLIGELRQRNRISIELAAAFHELWVRRCGMRTNAAVDARDVEALRDVASRAEREISSAPSPAPDSSDLAANEDEGSAVHAVPLGGRAGAWTSGPAALILLLLAALLLIAAAWWWTSRRDDAPERSTFSSTFTGDRLLIPERVKVASVIPARFRGFCSPNPAAGTPFLPSKSL